MRAGVRDVMSRYVSQHIRRAFVSNGAMRGFISAHLLTTTPGASSIGPPPAQLHHTSTVPFDERLEEEAAADRQDVDCFLEAQPVPKLDPFAKSRVLQYLKRLPIVATPWIGGPQCVETLLFMGGLDSAMSTATSKATFVSRILIPLVVTAPSTSNTSVPFAQWIRDVAVEGDDVLIATGVAHTTRGDADTLAAMHAERLLDGTGRCLYVVPAAQRRYAAQRKAEGSHAPQPGDPIVKVPVANLPLPCTLSQKSCGGVHEVIRKLPRRPLHQEVAAAPSSPAQPFVQRVKKTSPPAAATQQGAALPNDEVVGVEDETENGTYMLCNVNTSRINSNPVIMTSPALIDKGSVARVSRRLFGLDDMLDRHVITTSEAVAGQRRGTPASNESMPAAMFTCSFSLDRTRLENLDATLLPTILQGEPHHDWSMTGKGKASTRERALQLCAMHLELLLYRAGVALFPSDPVTQLQYDRSAENNGWPQCLRHPFAPEPLPLKELHPTLNEYQYRNQRRAPLSNEEKFMRYHGEAFNYAKTTIPIDALHPDFCIPGFLSVELAELALEAFQKAVRMRALAFVVACAGDFRTTLILYNCERAAQLVKPHNCGDHPTGSSDSIHHHNDGSSGGVDEAALLTEGIKSSTPTAGTPLPAPTSFLPVPAFGVGPTLAASRALCILHALEEINAMNLPLFPFHHAKQSEYASSRRALGLYAPDDHNLGHVPRQSRILHQVHAESDVQWLLKRERGGRDGGSFEVNMAYAPTPSFSHDERRSPHVVQHEELGMMLQLHSLRQFMPVDEATLNSMIQLYSSPLRTYIDRHQRLYHRSAKTTSGLSFQSVVEDQGSGWRHRSTVWLRVPIPISGVTLQGEILAVGRGTRLIEAERACIAHAVVLLTHLGLDVHLNISSPSAVESHTRLMRVFHRAVFAKPTDRLNTLFSCDDIGDVEPMGERTRRVSAKVHVECPPLVLQSTFEAMKAHSRLYNEMRSCAVQRWRRE